MRIEQPDPRSNRAAKQWAAEYDAGLRADDPRFRRGVQIQAGDGSSMFFDSAFLTRWKGWIVLFTEHHGWRVYDPEDLLFHAEYERIERLPEEIDERR